MANQAPMMVQQGSQEYRMSDQELMRLAQMMQQQRGEGLAFVNQDEAALLKALGGAGEPMKGTEGAGVGGGPIRSYADVNKDGEKIDISPNKFSTDPKAANIYHESQSGGGGGGSSQNTTVTYKDQYGKIFPTQQEAWDSDKAINEQKAAIEGLSVKSDATYEYLDSTGGFSAYSLLSEADKKEAFRKSLLASGEAAKGETFYAQDTIGAVLRDYDQTLLEDADIADLIALMDQNSLSHLSESQQRALVQKMRDTALREARFTLTPEEIEEFERDAITTAPVADATGQTVGDIDEAGRTEVGTIENMGFVTIAEDGTPTVDTAGLEEIKSAENEVVQKLISRIDGLEPSVAQIQHQQATEQNMMALLGAQAGAQADPARLRQVQKIFADVQQTAVGQTAHLRAAETQAAEQQLVEIYKTQGTRELSVALSEMETERMIAIEQGNLDQARELSVMQAQLTRVITQANIDTDTELANLETRKQKMIEQGRLDQATSLANLQKDIAISQTDGELALRSRALDDAMALANYQGEMALEGLETKIDIANLEADLTALGFELQLDIAGMDNQTKMAVANLAARANRAAAASQERASMISAIAIIGAAYFTGGASLSDKREKKKIKKEMKPKSEVDKFLDALTAYTYEYKSPEKAGAKKGRMVGVMAQDLLKTDIGKQMVVDTSEGYKVDFQQGLAAMLAAQASMNHRLKNLEGGAIG